MNKISPEKVINQTNLPNFSCVLSDIEILRRKGEKTRSTLTQHGEGRILARLFEFVRFCEAADYDYLFIDCMPGITYRALDALIVADRIMVVTRPAKSELTGVELVISECYSKLEGVHLNLIFNQVERKEDLVTPPNEKDIQLAEHNIRTQMQRLADGVLNLPLLHTFYRIPFVTERPYVIEEEHHPFTAEISEFCHKLLSDKIT